MSDRPPLSQRFMETVPYLFKNSSKQKQLQLILSILLDYPNQFEEFIDRFGMDRYYEIVPKC